MKRIDQIREHASPFLAKEIEDLIDQALAEEWAELHDFETAFDIISSDADSAHCYYGTRKFRTETRKVHIALGEYVPMTEEQVKNTICSSGKPWAFKMNGIPYEWAI